MKSKHKFIEKIFCYGSWEWWCTCGVFDEEEYKEHLKEVSNEI